MTISTERLEEIRDGSGCVLLVIEAQQMADELLALRQSQQEPVAEIKWDGTELSVQNVADGFSFGVTKVYAVPPAPAVPDEFNKIIEHLQDAHSFIENSEAFGLSASSGILQCGTAEWDIDASKQALNACRAAMLQQSTDTCPLSCNSEQLANSPVIPDDWIKCGERLPQPSQRVLVYRPDALDSGDPLIRIAGYIGGVSWSLHGFDCYCTPTHWMPLPADPQPDHSVKSTGNAGADHIPGATKMVSSAENRKGRTRRLIEPQGFHVDINGFWTHPNFPDTDESWDEKRFSQWAHQEGLETNLIFAYVGGWDVIPPRWWEFRRPAGDGWFVGSIHDTEDGPVCVWLRNAGYQNGGINHG